MESYNIRQRLNDISGNKCSYEFIYEFYDIDLNSKCMAEIVNMFTVWSKNLRTKPVVLTEELVDRWAFELFLQYQRLIPAKLAAIQLAMSPSHLFAVIDAMTNEGLIPKSLLNGQVFGLYPTNMIENLHHNFPKMRTSTFGTHSAFIRRFHSELNEHYPALNIETILSMTSLRFKEAPPEVAYEFDIITMEPIGNGYQIWLDFGKPISLRPDTCSVITYARHEDALREYVVGGDPQEDGLEKAKEFLKKENGTND